MLHANAFERRRNLANRCRRNFAFVGATHRAGDRPPHVNAVGLCRVSDCAKAFDAFFNRTIDVAVAESLAGRSKDDDFLWPKLAWRAQQRRHAFHVGHQYGITHIGVALNTRHHLGVVAHLRHPLGADVTGDLNLLQARRLQTVHQLNLHRRADGKLFILQAIARADFNQFDSGRQAHINLSLFNANFNSFTPGSITPARLHSAGNRLPLCHFHNLTGDLGDAFFTQRAR